MFQPNIGRKKNKLNRDGGVLWCFMCIHSPPSINKNTKTQKKKKGISHVIFFYFNA